MFALCDDKSSRFLTANITVSSEAFDFSYVNAKGRDASVNTLDEWSAAPLGATVTSQRPKPEDTEGEQRQPIVEYGVVRWTPSAHRHWPADFRAAVRALLQCRKNVGGSFAALPRDVVHYIVALLSRNYVPSIDRYANPNPFAVVAWKK